MSDIDLEMILTKELGLPLELVKRGRLLTSGALESFDLVKLVLLLEDRFNVEFPASSLTPSNFDSIKSLTALVAELRKDS